MRPQLLLTVLPLFAIAPATTAWGQTQVCEILATNLRQDEMVQGTDRQRFESHKAILRDNTFASWQKAASSTLFGSVTVPSYVDATLDTTSNEQNWQTNWRTFLSTSFDQIAARSQSLTTIRSASVAAMEQVVKCADVFAESNRYGFFAVLERVTDNRDAFAIRFHNRTQASSGWAFNGITISPDDPNLTCNGGQIDIQAITPTNPYRVSEASFFLNCRKSPTTELLITANTTQGASSRSFTVNSVQSDLAELRERLQRLEATVVPRGTMAYFAQASCPQTWEPVEEARGRYIVGVTPNGRLGHQIGTPLSDGENRPTGAHTHPQGGWPLHINTPGTNGIQQGSGGASATAPTQTGSVDGAVTGTNAPYVQYLICRKL